jgi:hypothetical protein
LCGANVSLEVTLFLFVFPQENRACNGLISIHEYLKYKMSFLFVLSTFSKPYLLLPHDI